MSRRSYGRPRGWQVEHSVPRARGGTNRLNNLYGAHARCNQQKGTRSSRAARAQHGYIRAPMCRAERVQWQMVGGFAIGAGAGYLLSEVCEVRKENRWWVIAGCGLAGLAAVYFATR